MFDGYYRLTLPESLSPFWRGNPGLPTRTTCNKKYTFSSNLNVNRDQEGRISSVDYFSADGELLKKVIYQGEKIIKENHYRRGRVFETIEFENDLIKRKSFYHNGGQSSHSYEYEYNRKNAIVKIHKKTPEHFFCAKFKYDDFDRITSRTISVDGKNLLEQNFKYDILDRIILYSDDNQTISVNNVSQNNELISYVITDKMCNRIKVENHFNNSGYIDTEISLNGHSSTIKDISYVDNVMLKKPYTSEEDLDLIISNLFRNNNAESNVKTDRISDISSEIIDQNIVYRAVPISIRKRLLYNLAIQV